MKIILNIEGQFINKNCNPDDLYLNYGNPSKITLDNNDWFLLDAKVKREIIYFLNSTLRGQYKNKGEEYDMKHICKN